jgi:type I restriction enzyme S subunit
MNESNSQLRLLEHGVYSIPEGWSLSKVKYLADYINGYPFKPDDWGEIGKPILRIQNLSDPTGIANKYDGTLSEGYLVRTGDLLISWSASLGVYEWQGEEAWLNQHIFKVSLHKEKVTKPYFKWLAEWFITELAKDAHGSTMQHLTKDAFGSFPLLLPLQEVQTRIALFLDFETARIDLLIATKQNILNLLAEKRRALITSAVTRGINPKVKLKDSGFSWLGEVPEHWDIERSKWLFKERDIRSEFGDEELMTVSHLTGVTTRAEKNVNMFKAESQEGCKICERNDLVINTLWAWMGAMGVSPQRGIVSPAYNVYEPCDKLDPSYVDYLVRMPIFAQEAIRFSKGVWSSRLRLYPEGLYEIWFPVPPIEEQKAIAEYLAVEATKIDALQEATGRTIALLRERRTALISAAVTGKIDIRGEFT